MINIETKDTHAEAATGARLSLELVQKLAEVEDWEDEISEILEKHEDTHAVEALRTVLFC